MVLSKHGVNILARLTPEANVLNKLLGPWCGVLGDFTIYYWGQEIRVITFYLAKCSSHGKHTVLWEPGHGLVHADATYDQFHPDGAYLPVAEDCAVGHLAFYFILSRGIIPFELHSLFSHGSAKDFCDCRLDDIVVPLLKGIGLHPRESNIQYLSNEECAFQLPRHTFEGDALTQHEPGLGDRIQSGSSLVLEGPPGIDDAAK